MQDGKSLMKISKHSPKKGTKHMRDLGQKKAEMQIWTYVRAVPIKKLV
jgi:hypothetical protein